MYLLVILVLSASVLQYNDRRYQLELRTGTENCVPVFTGISSRYRYFLPVYLTIDIFVTND